MLDNSELNVFIYIAKYLNFSRVAKEVGLSAPQVSKILAGLESKLGSKLVHRTTRTVRLTSEGKYFLPFAEKAMESLVEASHALDQGKNPGQIKGKMRLTAPNTLGVRFLAKPLKEFAQKFPLVQVEVLLNDSYLDFASNEIDLAIRVMKPIDSSLVAKKISENEVCFYASSSYIQKMGLPKSLSDLRRHPVFCIAPHLLLKFKRCQKTLKEVIQPPKFSCTNGDLFTSLAVQGAGIAVRSKWGAARDVQQGLLQEIILEDLLVSETEVYLVYPKHPQTFHAIKYLISLLSKSRDGFEI